MIPAIANQQRWYLESIYHYILLPIYMSPTIPEGGIAVRKGGKRYTIQSPTIIDDRHCIQVEGAQKCGMLGNNKDRYI